MAMLTQHTRGVAADVAGAADYQNFHKDYFMIYTSKLPAPAPQARPSLKQYMLPRQHPRVAAGASARFSAQARLVLMWEWHPRAARFSCHELSTCESNAQSEIMFASQECQ